MKYVHRLNLHENKNEVLLHYTSDFELIGSMLLGEIQEKKLDLEVLMTLKRILMVSLLITFLNTFITGWLYKLNTPEFNRVNRSQYGRGTDFNQDIVENIANICYIPTSGNCFINCNSHLTGKRINRRFF